MSVIDVWFAALTGGEYKQGKGQLRYTYNGRTYHCCLGVLCEISKAGKWSVRDEFIPYGTGENCEGNTLPVSLALSVGMDRLGTFQWSSLPEELRDQIKARCPGLIISNDQTDLTILNDHGLPFHLIAEIIQFRPKGLFQEGRTRA